MSRRKGWQSATRTEYRGVLYASKAEARYARHLDRLVKKGEVKSWERQVRIPLMVNGEKVCVIQPDFRVTYPDGRVELHEVKGFAQPIWRLKMKLLKALHPDVEYVVVPAKATVGL